MVVHGTTDSTTRWAVGGGAGVDPNVMSLVALPGGKILTAGVNDRLIESGDGGATWAPFADQPPYRPAGVARDGDSGATVVWTTGCAAGTADPADSVLRHVDG
jgi:hypothetical protein